MKSSIPLFPLLAFCFFTAPAWPQQLTGHQHGQTLVIDGSSHPELIPDLTAYRLWLVSVSRGPNPTPGETAHQGAQINKVGIGEADRRTLISTLTTFHIQYQRLIQSFNTEAALAWAKGESPDTASFLLQRDQIVQSAIDALKANLGTSGWASVAAHVQAEKANMRITGEVTQ